MKKAIPLAVLSVCVVVLALVSFVVKANSNVSGLGFSAPEINGRDRIPNPERGAIVLDSSDGHFYGNDDGTSSGWVSFSKPDSTGAANGDVLTADGSGGTTWQSPAAASVPTGTILSFAGTTPPSGFLLCDGTAVSRSVYSNLFSVIGESYGAGDGSTTFNLPDL